MSESLQPCRLLAARLSCPWYSPDKYTGVGFRVLLKGIFPTQRSNPSVLCFLHWQGFTTSSTWEACQVSYYLLEVFAVKNDRKLVKNWWFPGKTLIHSINFWSHLNFLNFPSKGLHSYFIKFRIQLIFNNFIYLP